MTILKKIFTAFMQGEEGMALVAVIMGMLILSAIGVTMTHFVSSNAASASDDLQSSQAFYVAEGGMQYVLMNQLNGDSDYSNNVSPTAAPFGAPSISLNPGQFWVEYLNETSTSMTARVTARVGNATRAVQQAVTLGGSGFKYVTMAKGNLSITNTTGTVSGDVVMSGNYSIAPTVTMLGNVTSNPNLTIPPLDMSVYRNMTTSTYTGTMTISGNYTGNTYITKNLNINAGSTINGVLYVHGNVAFNGNNIVVNGTIVTDGNLNCANRTGLQFISQPIDANHQMPAIVVDGNVGDFTNADNMKVRGLVWSTGNLSLNNTDNLDYVGSFMVDGNASFDTMTNFKLSFNSTYVTGVPGMTDLGGSNTASMVLSGWQSY